MQNSRGQWQPVEKTQDAHRNFSWPFTGSSHRTDQGPLHPPVELNLDDVDSQPPSDPQSQYDQNTAVHKGPSRQNHAAPTFSDETAHHHNQSTGLFPQRSHRIDFIPPSVPTDPLLETSQKTWREYHERNPVGVLPTASSASLMSNTRTHMRNFAAQVVRLEQKLITLRGDPLYSTRLVPMLTEERQRMIREEVLGMSDVVGSAAAPRFHGQNFRRGARGAVHNRQWWQEAELAHSSPKQDTKQKGPPQSRLTFHNDCFHQADRANLLAEQNTIEQQSHLPHPEPKTHIIRAMRAPETTVPVSQLASDLLGPHHVELTLLQRKGRVKKQLNRLQAQQSGSSCAVSSSVPKDRHAKCESEEESNRVEDAKAEGMNEEKESGNILQQIIGKDSLVARKCALESGK
jgi:hypothetical protein